MRRTSNVDRDVIAIGNGFGLAAAYVRFNEDESWKLSSTMDSPSMRYGTEFEPRFIVQRELVDDVCAGAIVTDDLDRVTLAV